MNNLPKELQALLGLVTDNDEKESDNAENILKLIHIVAISQADDPKSLIKKAVEVIQENNSLPYDFKREVEIAGKAVIDMATDPHVKTGNVDLINATARKLRKQHKAETENN